MHIATYKGFAIHLPTSGGKAGKGCNKTSTIQVRQNSCVAAQFRFSTTDESGSRNAIKKARAWCDKQAPGGEIFSDPYD